MDENSSTPANNEGGKGQDPSSAALEMLAAASFLGLGAVEDPAVDHSNAADKDDNYDDKQEAQQDTNNNDDNNDMNDEDGKKEVTFSEAVPMAPDVSTDNNTSSSASSPTISFNRHHLGPGMLEEIAEDPTNDSHNNISQRHQFRSMQRAGTQKSFKRVMSVLNLGQPPLQVVRKIKKVDIETGEQMWREMTALPVVDFKTAMDPVERRIRAGGKAMTQNALQQSPFEDDNSDDDDEVQYRLCSRISNQKFRFINNASKEMTLLTKYLHWTFRASFISVILTDFVAFFLICLFWACCIYVGALESPRCFVANGDSLAEIENWRENFFFADAFQLSWTTFSTVGYGIVYPQVNKQSVTARPDCMGFTFMVSLEAFVGVLFGAFCGSIMFGKIARIQSIASIQWSDPMVIRYGTGVLEPKPEDDEEDDDDDDDDDNDDNNDTNGVPKPANTANIKVETGDDNLGSSQTRRQSKAVRFPCPVLEFRVINNLSSQKGGEILNATLSVVASTEAARAIESLQLTDNINAKRASTNLLRISEKLTKKTAKAKAIVRKTKESGKSLLRTSQAAGRNIRRGSVIQKMKKSIVGSSPMPDDIMSDISLTNSDFSSEMEMEPYNSAMEEQQELKSQLALASLAHVAATTHDHNKPFMVDGYGLFPRRMFSSMAIETDTHPFFKRVWNCRHVLDENSPLLSVKAKKLIQKYKGKWSLEMSNPEFIRKELHFHQIIVSLSGTHNSSGSDVYGMHVYDFGSVNVGYRFVQMLHTNEAGRMYVDTELLNDVREQRGGGAEAIRGVQIDNFGEEIMPKENDAE